MLAVQAGYYILTGTAPLVSRRAFEALTGKKSDWWLVQMVGLLAVAIGSTISLALMELPVPPPVIALSLSSALSFASIDAVYSAKRRISPIYAVDALVELALVLAIALSSDP